MSYKHICELFEICIQRDNYKIGLELYLNYLKPGELCSKALDLLIGKI